MYNQFMMHGQKNIKKSNKYYIFWVCVCNLCYPAFNAHAPYFHLWPFPFWNIFPHYLINGRIFEKKIIEHVICVLIFSTNFVWNISYSKKNWARYDHICVLVFMYSTGYSCQILMELEFSQQIFKNIQKYQIPWKSFQWEPSCSMSADEQTNRK